MKKKTHLKIITMLLSLAMVLSFTVCGNVVCFAETESVQPAATESAQPAATESAQPPATESAASETPEVIVGTVAVRDTQMRYAKFGTGEKTLLILPGLSLTYTTASAEKTANNYSMFTSDYTIFMLDVIDDVPDDYTIAQMGQDDVDVLKELGVTSMDIYGNSMGGIQAVWIAGEYPEMVNHLVVCSTACAGNELSHSVVQNWIKLAMSGDRTAFAKDMVEHMYSPSYIERKGDKLTAGSDQIPSELLARFVNIASAADSADVTEQAEKIICPTMVFGSLGDKLFTEQPSIELAEIVGCDCYLYSNKYGHCVFSEAAVDVKNRVMAFLSQDQE